jgi:diaminopimelate epimerase
VTTQLPFNKYHGLGNDFIVVDLQDPTEMPVERAVALCDRHFGVGADGVLIVTAPRSPGARATMQVINSDGSRPEMCGNGLRCVVLHLCRKAQEGEASFLVDTDAGPLLCELSTSSGAALIATEIGRGIDVGGVTHEDEGETLEFVRIQTGNPHAICFREQLSDERLDRVGASVSRGIEGGANVEIATVRAPTNIHVGVWERGVGRTLACGTGAAATAIAAARSGRSPFDEPILIELPGGTLSITVSPTSEAVLRGPAVWVYEGLTPL